MRIVTGKVKYRVRNFGLLHSATCFDKRDGLAHSVCFVSKEHFYRARTEMHKHGRPLILCIDDGYMHIHPIPPRPFTMTVNYYPAMETL